MPPGSATFAYDATGAKLRKASTVSGTTTYTDYISGIQHSGTTSEAIEYIMTEEGQAAPTSTTSYDYQYFLGDNLGNIRESFGTKTGAAVQYQRDDYYPFGMEIAGVVTSPKNEYLYNKKELQSEFAEYDYGARFYDPVIARWTSVDPLAEASRRWSTYRYGFDDPLRFIDPDGMTEEDDILNDKSFEKQSDQRAKIEHDLDNTKTSTYYTYENGEKTGEQIIKGFHYVYQSRTPNIYEHTVSSLGSGQEAILHYDSDKARQRQRRTAATGAYPSRAAEGLQKDEYPYASTFEGGATASVAYVPADENSKQGWMELGPLYKTLNQGDAFGVIPISNEKERQFENLPVPEQSTKPKASPVAIGVGIGGAFIMLLNLVNELENEVGPL